MATISPEHDNFRRLFLTNAIGYSHTLLLEGSRLRHPQQYRQQLEKILSSVGVKASFSFRGTHFLVTKLFGDVIPDDLYTPEIVNEIRADVRANRRANLNRLRLVREGRTAELTTAQDPHTRVWLDTIYSGNIVELPVKPLLLEEFSDLMASHHIETDKIYYGDVYHVAFLRFSNGSPPPPGVTLKRSQLGDDLLSSVRALADAKNNSSTSNAP